MSTNFIGQTRKQKRNCEEQQRRRKSIKERFPKTVTFHTYEDIDEKISRRQMKIAKAFEIVGEKIRQAEVKSLAITYYIYIHARKEKLRISRAAPVATMQHRGGFVLSASSYLIKRNQNKKSGTP